MPHFLASRASALLHSCAHSLHKQLLHPPPQATTRYLVDLSVVEATCQAKKPSKITAAAVLLARAMLAYDVSAMGDAASQLYPLRDWELEEATEYSAADLQHVVEVIHSLAWRAAIVSSEVSS